jgi:hypothetical protein
MLDKINPSLQVSSATEFAHDLSVGDSPVRETDVDIPILPLQHSAFHSVADTFRLYDVERLERIAGLETRLINRDLFR